jgi:methyl-accepting chemotaxis protein
MPVLAFQLSNETSLFWILVIIAVCFALMAISMLAVAIAVLRVVGIVRRLHERIEPLMQTANQISAQGKDIAVQGKEIAEKFSEMSIHLTGATKNLSESTALIREEIAEIKALVSDTAITAKEKVALVSRTVDRTNLQVRQTTDFIQTKVVEPAREVAAVMAGLRKGLEVLFAPTPRELDRVYGDDEMFIG